MEEKARGYNSDFEYLFDEIEQLKKLIPKSERHLD
jgi:hypothetical protein